MNPEIWNSSQIGGTGGALKALAKNLANQLNLNRTEMKRVVARVISERHGQGDVGDYNGHMFYVKPERIDLTEQITHSKEAFDDMITQKQSKMQRCVSKNQMQQPPCSKSRSRSLTYNMAMRHHINNINNIANNSNINNIKPEKCPAVPNPPQVAGQMSKSKIKCTKSRQQIKRKPQVQNSQPQSQSLPSQSQPQCQAKCPPKPAKSLAKPKTLQGRPKLVGNKNNNSNNNKKRFVVRLEVKNLNLNLNRKPALSKRPQRAQASGSGSGSAANNDIQRLNAGKVNQQEKLRPMILIEPEPQPQPQYQIQPSAYAQTEAPTGRKTILKKKRSSIVKQLPPNVKSKFNSSRRTYDPWQEPKRLATKRLRAGGMLTRPNRVPMNPMYNLNRGSWRHPYQYPTVTQRSNAKKQGAKSKCGPRIRPKINNSNSNKQPVTTQVSKQSLERLAKQLERDEAIDDPERLEAGSMLHFKLKPSCSTNSRRRVVKRRPYKLSARLEELAKPVFHGKPGPDKLPLCCRSRSRSPIRKPKLKLKARRRRRRVLVDSSLGSIAGLKGTSRSGLTPAKRHLTLAFMNKESRSPRRSRSVMWR